jgi:hypothetical protein
MKATTAYDLSAKNLAGDACGAPVCAPDFSVKDFMCLTPTEGIA